LSSNKLIPEGGFVDDEFPDAAAIGRIGDHHPKRKYLEARRSGGGASSSCRAILTF